MVQSFLVGLTFRRNNITRCIKLDLTTCNLSHLEYTLSLSIQKHKRFLTYMEIWTYIVVRGMIGFLMVHLDIRSQTKIAE